MAGSIRIIMPWRTRYDLCHWGGRNSYLQVPGYSLTIFGRYIRCTWADGYISFVTNNAIPLREIGWSCLNFSENHIWLETMKCLLFPAKTGCYGTRKKIISPTKLAGFFGIFLFKVSIKTFGKMPMV
jgi:hypothetical protein